MGTTRNKIFGLLLGSAMAAAPWGAHAADYPAPTPLKAGSQAGIKAMAPGGKAVIAYLPPATEFPYYMAIGEGIKAEAAKAGVETFMLAPQSGADINGQMGMIQDAITRGVAALILSTHDEAAAAPLVRQAVDKGVAVVIVNSDIRAFPTPVHAVVGYSQRNGTARLGDYFLAGLGGKPAKLLVIEGQPGYHSTERVGGFLDAVKGKPGVAVEASVPGGWNVEGGNTAAMDLLQAHPDATAIFAANDNMIIGASLAAKALGKSNMTLLGNDGDTAALEAIADGTVTATVDTTPFAMGQIAFQVTQDVLHGSYPGGFVETPAVVADKGKAAAALKQPDRLYPKPSHAY